MADMGSKPSAPAANIRSGDRVVGQCINSLGRDQPLSNRRHGVGSGPPRLKGGRTGVLTIQRSAGTVHPTGAHAGGRLGLPLLAVLMVQVIGYATPVLLYQASPIVVAMGMGMGRVPACDGLRLAFLMPLDYAWFQAARAASLKLVRCIYDTITTMEPGGQRREETLQPFARPRSGAEPVHLLVDSTGFN
jgi:hypothetical protein